MLEIYVCVHILASLSIKQITFCILNIPVFCISGQIRALKDCWIVGDKFINDVYYGLQEANQENIKLQNEKLYLYDQYNVNCSSSNPLSKIKEAPARLVNSFIHALNEQDKITNTKHEERFLLFASFLP